MVMVFRAIGLHEVAIEGAVLNVGCSEEEEVAYNEIKSVAMIMFIQLISPQILVQCNRIHDPHELWKHLKSQYYSDTPFSFILQIHSLLTVGPSFDSSKPISEFIDKFETEWALHTQLSASSTSPSRTIFKELLAHDEAKRDFLLAILLPHMPNVIDNILTKDTMSYAEAKQCLVARTSGNAANASNASNSMSATTKICNW